MKKTIPLALVSAAALALSACGSATDASEEAIADNVEMPADEAMANTPEPVADPEAAMDDTQADAMEAASTAEQMVADDAAAPAPAETAAPAE